MRELIDGRAGTSHDPLVGEPDFWTQFTARIRAAADEFNNH